MGHNGPGPNGPENNALGKGSLIIKLISPVNFFIYRNTKRISQMSVIATKDVLCAL